MTDRRIAYGARCTWWDSVTEAKQLPSGVPCCPHCRGVLFEVPSEDLWWQQVDEYAASTTPGYRQFIEWVRGKCFNGQEAAHYRERGENVGTK